MVSDSHEVERPTLKLELVAAGVRDRLSLGVAIGVVGRGADFEHVGVKRMAGVDVKVPEVGIS